METTTVSDTQVLLAEAEAIRKRREGTGQNPNRPLLGVCFSGGGIRSATYNLGLVQGMSQSEVLPHVDYLSTVSGGGYIGTWLHAVTRRCCGGDPRNIARLLGRPEQEPHDVPERDPIAFLRKYSNYLAPDVGLFSADFWVIGGIWVRNIFLNQLIIVPFFAAISLLTFLVGIANRSIARNAVHMSWEIGVTAMLLLALVAYTGGGVGGAAVAGTHSAIAEKDRWDTLATGMICASLILLSSLGVTLASDYVTDVDRLARAGLTWIHVSLIMGGFFTVLFAVFQWRGKFAECYCERHGNMPGTLSLWYAALAGITTGFVFFGAMKAVAFFDDVYPGSWNTVAWGPPVITMAILAGASFHIGLMGVDYDDNAREWLARLGAFAGLFSFVWAGMFAISVFGPWWVVELAAYSKRTLAGVSGTWILTTAAGALAGKSSKTGDKPTEQDALSKGLEYLVKVAPVVFIAGYLLFISTGVHRGLAWWCGASHEMQLLGRMPDGTETLASVVLLAIALAVIWYLPRRIDINEFSMHHFYKNRLVRCYLGAANAKDRHPSPFTGFDPTDDVPLSSLRPEAGYYGPFAIYNTCLNLNRGSELAKRERKGEGFIFTPIYSGYDAPSSKEDVKALTRAETLKGAGRLQPYGYRPTEGFGYPAGYAMGTCMAISGAAANPNGGYHTSGPGAFLMTLLNVRLGWWVGNTRYDLPSSLPGPRNALMTLISELFAFTDSRSNFVNLSDGGHYENLGLYELVRRRCGFIIIGDGEEDPEFVFESLGEAVRKCRTDFGAEISIDPRPIRLNERGLNGVHAVMGTVRYADGSAGCLLYLKASLTGDESLDVAQYKSSHPDFPQQPTSNQFFTESQFESYRKLGLHIWQSATKDDPGGFFGLLNSAVKVQKEPAV